MIYFHKIPLFIVIAAALLFTNCQLLSKEQTVSSPNEEIKVGGEVQRGTLFYFVHYNSGVVIGPSLLGLETEKPFEGGGKIVSISKDSSDQWWEPVYGEYEKIHDHYNSMEIGLEEKGKSHRRLNIGFRAYDQGVAFRYVIPGQKDSVWKINNELSTFKVP